MKKILIIDDEIKLREAIGELLTFIGCLVIEAQDGLDGLEKVKLNKPDLIFCDIMMPKLDGYGFLKSHLSSEFSDIPVVFLTAKMEVTLEINGLDLGPKEYLKKPFTLQEIKEIINKYS